MTPLWRKAFDVIERPLAAGAEAWIQSETFMDLATHSIRIQRRMLSEAQQATERWLHLWGWVSRGDVLRLSNQVASLERQVRELRRDAEDRPHPLLNGRAPAGSRGRSAGSRPGSGGSRPGSGGSRPGSGGSRPGSGGSRPGYGGSRPRSGRARPAPGTPNGRNPARASGTATGTEPDSDARPQTRGGERSR